MRIFELIVLMLLLNLLSCQKSKVNKVENTNQIITDDTTDTIMDNIDTTKKETEKIDLQIEEIDTLKIISQINCPVLIEQRPYLISIDSIDKHKPASAKLDNEAQLILNALNCLGKIKDTDTYVSFLLLTGSESHYSSVVKLVSVSKINQAISQLDLSYKYGNEQVDEFVRSIIKNDSIIIREKETTFRYIHGIGKVDSSNIEKKYYKLLDKGELIEIDQ